MPENAPTPTPDVEPTEGIPADQASDSTPPASLGDTVGTGSVIALGCIGATLFLIVIGLLYILVTQLFG